MPLPNGTLGISRKDNPMVFSPFVQHVFGEGINPPPPGSSIMITETGVNMITEINDDLMITE